MRNILIIWAKELRDTVRDRRTLMVMVLVPILLTPALIVGMNALVHATSSKPVHIAVSGQTAAPQLVALLRRQPLVTVTGSANPGGAVKRGSADAGLVIAGGFASRVEGGAAGTLTVVVDSTQTSSDRALAAITAAREQYDALVVSRRLRARGVNPAVLNPVVVTTRDVATKQALAGFLLSLIVPAFLVSYSMIGGMYTAMDIAAGEKERFTLEALLLSPATKLQITLGKLLAVSTVSVVTIVLALAAIFVALEKAPLTATMGTGAGAALSLPAGSIALLVLLGVLLSLAFSALELALSILARSFKQAQSYIMPLYLVAFVPTYALAFVPGLKLATVYYLIPVVNTVLVFKETLVGAPAASHVLLTILTMLLFCFAAILVTLRTFRDERVLLRS